MRETVQAAHATRWLSEPLSLIVHVDVKRTMQIADSAWYRVPFLIWNP